MTLAFRVPSTVRPPSLLIALWRSGRFSHSPSTYVSSVQRTRWSSSDGTYPSQSGLPWAMTPESQIAEFVRWFRAHPSVPAAIVDRFRAWHPGWRHERRTGLGAIPAAPDHVFACSCPPIAGHTGVVPASPCD